MAGAAAVSAVLFHIPLCWICRCYSAKVMGSITPGKRRLRSTPICQHWMFFLTSHRLWMRYGASVRKDNICLSKHVLTIDGDMQFLFRHKKSPLNFAESTHSAEKTIREDNFMCGEEKKVTSLCVCLWESGKDSFKAGHRDAKKDIHPLHFYLLFLILFLIPYFLRGLRNIGLGHGTRRE